MRGRGLRRGDPLEHRLGQGAEQLQHDGVLVDAARDHVGLHEREVRREDRDAVVGELDAEPAPELFDGGLAHRVRDRAHAVEEGEDRADQHDLALCGDHLRAAPAATVFATPVTLTARVASMSAVGVLRRVAALASRPALAITTSRRPNRSTVCATAASSERAVADVGDAAEGVGRVQLAGPVWRRRVDVGHRDASAPVEQGTRPSRPDPAVATGDQDDLVGEVVATRLISGPGIAQGLAQRPPWRCGWAGVRRTAGRADQQARPSGAPVLDCSTFVNSMIVMLRLPQAPGRRCTLMARYSPEHKEATRRRMIETAGRRFKSDGIDGSGIATLVADAGLTNGAFYGHFASKDDLVASVVTQQLDGPGRRRRLPARRPRVGRGVRPRVPLPRAPRRPRRRLPLGSPVGRDRAL